MKSLLIVFILFFSGFTNIFSIDLKFMGKTDKWCQDQMTFCWNENIDFFPGVRIIAEPRLGNLMQFASVSQNKIENFNVGFDASFGLEFALYSTLVSLQTGVTLLKPLKFDSLSPIRSRIVSADGTIPNEISIFAGFSLFDGIIAFGYQYSLMDRQ
jgi:hypothetical protein